MYKYSASLILRALFLALALSGQIQEREYLPMTTLRPHGKSGSPVSEAKMPHLEYQDKLFVRENLFR